MVEADGLTIEAGGVRVTVIVRGGDDATVWTAARRAFEGACQSLSDLRDNDCCTPIRSTTTIIRGRRRKGSQAERIREIARELLADGKYHKQREIARVVRDELGAKAAKNVQAALKPVADIERGETFNDDGFTYSPAYIDRSVSPVREYKPTREELEGEGQPEYIRNYNRMQREAREQGVGTADNPIVAAEDGKLIGANGAGGA
jgi:hypothetical protein